MAKIRCIPVGPRYTPKVLLGIVNETRGMALATRVRAKLGGSGASRRTRHVVIAAHSGSIPGC